MTTTRGSPSSPNTPLPVSPAGFQTMFHTTRLELRDVKMESSRLLVRLINRFGQRQIESCVLADPPLMSLYDLFVQAEQRATNIISAQDVVVISGDSFHQPSNSLASVSGGGVVVQRTLSLNHHSEAGEDEPVN
ncbi:hypothetical protein ACFE04_021144 [Oxalis oulophora]